MRNSHTQTINSYKKSYDNKIKEEDKYMKYIELFTKSYILQIIFVFCLFMMVLIIYDFFNGYLIRDITRKSLQNQQDNMLEEGITNENKKYNKEIYKLENNKFKDFFEELE